MREGDLRHHRARLWVVEGVLAVVVWGQHEVHPSGIHGARHLARLQGLDQNARHNEGHGVVRGLPGLGVLLGRVANDAEGRLVCNDVDPLDGVGATRGKLWAVDERRDQTLERACGLVLVEAQLEVHPAHREVRAAVGQDEVERARPGAPPDLVAQGDIDVVLAGRDAGGGLEEAEDGLRVPEDVARADEAAHRPAHREHGGLCGDRCRGALGVRELLACADRAEGHVMSHGHADGALNLLC
mmetsp:Transcript_95273/g.246710  ORF Transcript_95273/g.246710 Transcript_95273/m.246710 type:complete len:242 (-) Transcript_95273:472-1197(-)